MLHIGPGRGIGRDTIRDKERQDDLEQQPRREFEMKEHIVLIDHGEEWPYDASHLQRTPDSLTPKPIIEETPSSTGLIAWGHRIYPSPSFAV